MPPTGAAGRNSGPAKQEHEGTPCPFSSKVAQGQTRKKAHLLLKLARDVARGLLDSKDEAISENGAGSDRDASPSAARYASGGGASGSGRGTTSGITAARLRDAQLAAFELMEIFRSEVDRAGLHLLWAPPRDRAHLCTLHAYLLRLLSDPQQMANMAPEQLEHCRNLLGGLTCMMQFLLSAAGNPHAPAPLRQAATATGRLLLRMQTLEAIAGQLAAGWAHPQLRLPSGQLRDILNVVGYLWLIGIDSVDTMMTQQEQQRQRHVDTARGDIQEEEEEEEMARAAAAMLAAARSGSFELSVRLCVALVREAVANGGDGGKEALLRAEVLSDLVATVSELPTNLRAGDHVYGQLLPWEQVMADEDGLGLGAASARGATGGPEGTVVGVAMGAAACVDAARVVLSGPCLQYALAAMVVAQLAAAEGPGGGGGGGSTYGLTSAQVLPVRGVLVRQLQQLHVGGLEVALEMWSWCMLQQPPVPFVCYSRSAVHALSMRVLQLAVRSAEHHAAAVAAAGGGGRQQRGQKQGRQQQQQEHDIQMKIKETDCAMVAMEALRCAALSARWPCAAFQSSSSTVAGAAAAAAGPVAAVEAAAAAQAAAAYWAAAVPALHMAVTHGEKGLGRSEIMCPPLPCAALQAMRVVVPQKLEPHLPPSPPPNLTAALAAGYLALLERAMRASGRIPKSCWELSPARTAAYALQVFIDGPLLLRLLAYCEPSAAASLMASGAKLVMRLQQLAKDEDALQRFCGLSVMNGRKMVAGVLQQHPARNLQAWMARLAAAEGAKQRAEQRGGGGGGATMAAAVAAVAEEKAEAASRAGSGAGDSYNSTSPHSVSPPFTAAVTAPGPTRQLLLLAAFTLREWLPATAALAVECMQREGAASSHGTHEVALSVTDWVPTLVHAHLAATAATAAARGVVPSSAAGMASGLRDKAAISTSGSSAASAAAPATATPSRGAFWRSLLLADTNVMQMLGLVLTRLATMWPDFQQVSTVQRDAHSAVAALGALTAAFPGEVAAALRDGRLPPPATVEPMVLSLLVFGSLAAIKEVGEERIRLIARLRELSGGAGGIGDGMAAAAAAGGRAVLPNPIVAGCVEARASAVGALLAAAVDPADVAGLLPAQCANPGCTNMAGDSEAGLVLLRSCKKCGHERYCSNDCRDAHWRAGHRDECGRRRG